MALIDPDLYQHIKLVHISCAVISVFGLIVRAALKYVAPITFQSVWVKTLPHVFDSVLLVSAIILAVTSQQYPLQDNWLTAKVVALLLYIAAGSMIIKAAKINLQYFFLVIITFLIATYIFAVAVNKNPLLI